MYVMVCRLGVQVVGALIDHTTIMFLELEAEYDNNSQLIRGRYRSSGFLHWLNGAGPDFNVAASQLSGTRAAMQHLLQVSFSPPHLSLARLDTLLAWLHDAGLSSSRSTCDVAP